MASISVHLVAGARPNFVKIAPLYRVLSGAPWCRPVLVHTGQHYDPELDELPWRELGLPEPDHRLGVRSGSHAEQTARAMVAYETLCRAEPPDWVVVVGDVNSTLACTLAAKKLGLRVAHLEAGLRSGDRSMPEELNRVLTDTVCDLLWTPSADADENLRREGAPSDRIERVGNIMIDAYEMLRAPIAAASGAIRDLGVEPRRYGIVTLHRPSNVDDADRFGAILTALGDIAVDLPLVFAVHPRTRSAFARLGGEAPLGVRLVSPLRYVPFMAVVREAAVVITDSGGLQEETTHLGIPCLTVRPSTERPITLTDGTNQLVEPAALLDAVGAALRFPRPAPARLPLWDGMTAQRVAASLQRAAGLPPRQGADPAGG